MRNWRIFQEAAGALCRGLVEPARYEKVAQHRLDRLLGNGDAGDVQGLSRVSGSKHLIQMLRHRAAETAVAAEKLMRLLAEMEMDWLSARAPQSLVEETGWRLRGQGAVIAAIEGMVAAKINMALGMGISLLLAANAQ